MVGDKPSATEWPWVLSYWGPLFLPLQSLAKLLKGISSCKLTARYWAVTPTAISIPHPSSPERGLTHMRQGAPSPGQHPKLDPFEVQIASLVILHRRNFLGHDEAALAELAGLSEDHLDYGRQLEKLTGKPSPFDPHSKEEITPAEVFLETDEFVGHTQSVPKPSIGMEIRHFRLTPRAEAERSQLGPTPEMARSVAVVSLIQHPRMAWEVLHAETRVDHRRQGIATMFYDRIAAVLDTKLWPSGWLSEDAHRFWQKRNPEAVQWHRQLDHLPGLWLSPKQLITMKAVAEESLKSP